MLLSFGSIDPAEPTWGRKFALLISRICPHMVKADKAALRLGGALMSGISTPDSDIFWPTNNLTPARRKLLEMFPVSASRRFFESTKDRHVAAGRQFNPIQVVSSNIGGVRCTQRIRVT